MELKKKAADYSIFGKEHIDEMALQQMDTAMQLPISISGALMPDAHVGYGLPIGGVLATDPQFVIPYAVGVDIGCRMCMSIYSLPVVELETKLQHYAKAIDKNSFFGIGSTAKRHFDTSLFDDEIWQSTALIRSLKDRAFNQLGTSGTGNHFVEFGVFTMKVDAIPEVPKGEYIALLSHSGSRGFGAKVASFYSSLAMKQSKLPANAKHLAWLDLETQDGQEYWIAMNLAGRYASANHHEIHNKIAKDLQIEPVLRVENHHNFAWSETLSNGEKVTIHRKGATPAHLGASGIIPGTMSTKGFLVRGKGEQSSLNSAAHGAGRRLSRTKAKKEFKGASLRDLMKKEGIYLMGAGLDEAPMAYKDIHSVMDSQFELVDVLGSFLPKIVKMADGRERAED